MKAIIHTLTKKNIDVFNLQLEDIHIEDIAHSLSCINRFNGHTIKPISVGQHSVYCARLCAGTPQELMALFHDAAEAYTGDITKWVKSSPEFKSFREIEDRNQRLIFQKFGIPLDMNYGPVEDADRIMVRFEGMMGFGQQFTIDHPNYPPLTQEELHRIGAWGFWNHRWAKDAFLDHYRMITNDASVVY